MKTPFNEDDYFKTSTMSFGEHLEELRRVLIKALYGLALAMVVGFVLAPHVVRFFKGPIESALEEYDMQNAEIADGVRYEGDVPIERQNLIRNMEMVPEYQKLEPSEFLANLQILYPGDFDNVRFSPHTFVADDFETIHDNLILQGLGQQKTRTPAAVAFASRLLSESKSGDGVGAAIWDLLGEEDRSLVGSIAEKSEEDVTISEKNSLALLLNRMVRNLALDTIPAFQSIEGTKQLAPVIRDLREELASAQEYKKEEVVHRLNKLLLSSYFSRELRPPQLVLVDVPIWKPVEVRVQSLTAQEPFMIWMKAAFVTGLVLASPWIFYQIWNFVAAGLYPHEKNYVYMYLPVSIFLFVAGALLAFGFVFQPVLNFLFYFNRLMGIDPDPKIGEWLGFVLLMPLAFGLSFQLPLVMLFLNRIGVVDVKTYLEHWRVSILIIAVAAMIITPGGDPYSMLLMMTPLIALYFLGIGMCRWMPRGRNPFFDPVHEP